MNNRITETFNQLNQSGKKGLIAYLTAGDPALTMTVPMLNALVAGGVDILEVGVPFSDPVADGGTIQAAHQRALKAKGSLKNTLALIKEFRQNNSQTPIVLMTYINPVETMGMGAFINAVSVAGVDGILLVDMPAEESKTLTAAMREKGICPIFLVAPTTQENRLKTIVANAQGFIYAITLKGVTGTKFEFSPEFKQQLTRIRQHSSLPITAGFGIRDGASAAKIAQFCDGVIVGSAFVKLVEQYQQQSDKLILALKNFATELRQALDHLQFEKESLNLK